MTQIQHAIANLEQAIGNLEGSITQLEQKPVEPVQQVTQAAPVAPGQQPDMFGAPPASNGNGSDMPQVDNAVMAERLDNAIEKVEALLKEG